MTAQLTHIALHVAAADSCAAFYREYCGMLCTRQHGSTEKPVMWLAQPGREQEFVIVLIGGGPDQPNIATGFSHLGFALPSREAVNHIAERARRDNCLLWEPREDPWPASYYCGVRDPAGNQVEFSFGQPLG